jgi:hypothetical protein
VSPGGQPLEQSRLSDPAYDVTCNRVIDIRDIIIVTRAFGT